MPKNDIHCTIGTAGHIDHGKTSLVRALTGIDTDRLIEEKKRGLTIDLGFAHLDLRDKDSIVRAAIVDVPGHERFIKNMLAGTTGIDAVLFTVAADDGIMPQTREHLDIIDLLGVKRGVIAITKADLASPGRLREVEGAVKALIESTALAGSPIIPVSSVTGEGIEALKRLLFTIAKDARRGLDEAAFRLPVDRSFAIKGFGAVVTGTVASGSAGKGDELTVFPTGVHIKVRGIQSLHESAERVSSGQRAALNITGAAHHDIRRGYTLISGELALALASSTKRPAAFDCHVKLLPSSIDIFKKKTAARLKLYHLTDEALATVRVIGPLPDNTAHVTVRVSPERPMLMLRGDRFILRDPAANTTAGGGTVALAYYGRMPERPGRTRPCGPGAGAREAFVCALPAGGFALPAEEACLMLNVRQEKLVGDAGGSIISKGGFLFDAQDYSAFKARLKKALADFHRQENRSPGAPEQWFMKAFKKELSEKDGADGLLKVILEDLATTGELKRTSAGTYALSDFLPSRAATKAEVSIAALFGNGADLKAVSSDELKALGLSKAGLDGAVKEMQAAGSIIKLKEGVYVSGEAAKKAKAALTGHLAAKGSIKASEFRDLLGCGRKLAIEILEYFDKERITLRQGDIRTLR